MSKADRRCSGAMTAKHTGQGEAEYRLPTGPVVLCGPCADAAAKLGMINRRSGPR